MRFVGLFSLTGLAMLFVLGLAVGCFAGWALFGRSPKILDGYCTKLRMPVVHLRRDYPQAKSTRYATAHVRDRVKCEPNPILPDATGPVRFGCALLLCLALPGVADAAALKAVIHAPPTATSGDDVHLDSSESTGEILARHWTITAVPPTALVAGRKQFDLTDKIKPRLLSYAGNYTIGLTVVGTDGELDRTEVTVIITGVITPTPVPCPVCPDCPKPVPPAPTPTPVPPLPNPTPPEPEPPKPVPPPEPMPIPTPDVVPVGEFNIAPPTAKIVSAIVDPAKAEHAKALADAGDALAAQIAAGTVTGAQDVINKFGDAVKALDSPAWVTGGAKFMAELGKVYAANKDKLKVSVTGTIVDAAGWATLVRECSAGVRYGAGIK